MIGYIYLIKLSGFEKAGDKFYQTYKLSYTNGDDIDKTIKSNKGPNECKKIITVLQLENVKKYNSYIHKKFKSDVKIHYLKQNGIYFYTDYELEGIFYKYKMECS